MHQSAEEFVEFGAVERTVAFEDKSGDLVVMVGMVVVVGWIGARVFVVCIVFVSVVAIVVIMLIMLIIVLVIGIVRLIGRQEIRVQFQLFIEVEAAYIEYF